MRGRKTDHGAPDHLDRLGDKGHVVDDSILPEPLQQRALQGDLVKSDGTVDVVANCRLPPFWRANPALWFVQVEAAFQLNRVRGDDTKYYMVIGQLDSDALQEVEDVVRAPPADRKYAVLKTAILSRLADSS